MDRKTRKIPYVFDKNVKFGKFVEILATQFKTRADLPKLKAQCYKIFVENHAKYQTEETLSK